MDLIGYKELKAHGFVRVGVFEEKKALFQKVFDRKTGAFVREEMTILKEASINTLKTQAQNLLLDISELLTDLGQT